MSFCCKEGRIIGEYVGEDVGEDVGGVVGEGVGEDVKEGVGEGVTKLSSGIVGNVDGLEVSSGYVGEDDDIDSSEYNAGVTGLVVGAIVPILNHLPG